MNQQTATSKIRLMTYQSPTYFGRRSQWPRGLKRTSAAASVLRLWVRIPPGAWMFVMSVVCCQVEDSAPSWSLVQRSPTDCGESMCVCDLETLWMRRPWPTGGCRAKNKQTNRQRLEVKVLYTRLETSLNKLHFQLGEESRDSVVGVAISLAGGQHRLNNSNKINWGTRWRGWLRHCTTSWKVAGSIPDGVTGIFHWHNPSGRTMTLELTRLLTEMSTRSILW